MGHCSPSPVQHKNQCAGMMSMWPGRTTISMNFKSPAKGVSYTVKAPTCVPFQSGGRDFLWVEGMMLTWMDPSVTKRHVQRAFDSHKPRVPAQHDTVGRYHTVNAGFVWIRGLNHWSVHVSSPDISPNRVACSVDHGHAVSFLAVMSQSLSP